MTAPPSTCRFSCTGLITIPGSTAIVYFSTATLPVPGVTDPWQRRRFADRQLPRVVLLQLPWCSHAVVTETDREGRRLLSELKRSVPGLGHVGNVVVDPWVGNRVHGRSDASR